MLVQDTSRKGDLSMGGLILVSFTNPLAAGSGLVERTPKKVGF